MEMRDALHGSIALDSGEVSIVESPFFQRLRRIKQLGFAETAFPAATHTRFIHSLGAMHVASRAFDNLFSETPRGERVKLDRFRQLVRSAALLHDVGHGPLSHTSESAMPMVGKRKRLTKTTLYASFRTLNSPSVLINQENLLGSQLLTLQHSSILKSKSKMIFLKKN